VLKKAVMEKGLPPFDGRPENHDLFGDLMGLSKNRLLRG
jgi:hypothetical protein